MEILWVFLFCGSPALAAATSVSVSSPILRAQLGGDVLLGCTFTQGSPTKANWPGILWYQYYDDETKVVHHHRGSQEVKDSSPSQDPAFRGRTLIDHSQVVHGDASIRLSGVRMGDAGLYRCIVTEAGSIAYSQTLLEVYTPYQDGRLSLSRLKETITGNCEFSRGYPQAELQWHYLGGDLINADGTQKVTKDPDGLYSLRGTLWLYQRGHTVICCSWRNSYPRRNSTICQEIDDVFLSQKQYPGTLAIVIFLLFFTSLFACHSLCQGKAKGKKGRALLGLQCLDPQTPQEKEIRDLIWCNGKSGEFSHLFCAERSSLLEAEAVTKNSFGTEIILLGSPSHGEELLLRLRCHVCSECLTGVAEPTWMPLQTLDLRNGLSISVESDFAFTVSYLTHLEARYKTLCSAGTAMRMKFAFVYSCAEKMDNKMRRDIGSLFHYLRLWTGSYPAVVLIDAKADRAPEVVSFFKAFDANRLLIFQTLQGDGGAEENFHRFLDVCLHSGASCRGRTNGWRTQNESTL